MICWWEQLADLLGQLYNFTICSDSDRRFDGCGRCSCQLAQFNKHHGIEIPNLETMVQKWRPHTQHSTAALKEKLNYLNFRDLLYSKCNKTCACFSKYLYFKFIRLYCYTFCRLHCRDVSLPHFKTESSPTYVPYSLNSEQQALRTRSCVLRIFSYS